MYSVCFTHILRLQHLSSHSFFTFGSIVICISTFDPQGSQDSTSQAFKDDLKMGCIPSSRAKDAGEGFAQLKQMVETANGIYQDYPVGTRDYTVEDVMLEIQNATCTRKDLQAQLADIIHEAGWWDEITAQYLLDALAKVLQSGEELSPTLKKAYDQALEEARKIKELATEFAEEHPILVAVVCAVIVLGLLYMFLPELFGLLGFGELGPIEGSFAARWQSLLGDVPYGSMFAYLQRLGMTLK